MSYYFFSVAQCNLDENYVLAESEIVENKKINEIYFNKYCSSRKMVIVYSENGLILAKTFFLNNLLEGKQTFYNFNGKIMISYSYRKGKKNGPSHVYSIEGIMIRTDSYKNDTLVLIP